MQPPSATDAEPSRDAPLNRNPERPAWELDLTHTLRAVDDPDATGEGVPLAAALSRKQQETMLPTPGRSLFWKTELTALPAEWQTAWPNVLEWDESRLVRAVQINGQNTPPPVQVRSAAWSGGEGIVVLPGADEQGRIRIAFQSDWLTQLYPNGFGRLRVRPAELIEAVEVHRKTGALSLKNRSTLPLVLQAHIRAEDYFGTVLAREVAPVTLAPEGTWNEDLPASILTAAASPDHHRTVIHLNGYGRTSPAFVWTDPNRPDNRQRPEVLRLAGGWEWVPSPKSLSSAPPKSGWKPIEQPRLSSAQWKHHAHWFRIRCTVPASWTSRRGTLYIGRVLTHARVWVNGKSIGETAQWQTPGWIPLPDPLQPGATLELAFGVTDFTAALRPGLSLPPDGDNRTPGDRALAGPVDVEPPGLERVELLGVPETRTEHAVLRTRGRTVEAFLDLRNDSPRVIRVRPVLTVFDAGQSTGRIEGDETALAPGTSQQVRLPALDIPSARLWNTETPQLYEARIELLDTADKAIDTRRERFGFRELGIAGGRFQLNGEPVAFWGDSHSVHYAPPERNLWPAGISTNRFPRTYLGSHTRMDTADETGMAVKLELGSHGALHRERYAYQEPVMWERLREQIRRMTLAHINRPSVLMIDVGNELNFARPGEPERMAELYRQFEAFDPTRVISNSGGYPPIIPGARVSAWHGWPHYQSRRDWFFFHPEDRPAYLKDKGFYFQVPSHEDKSLWEVLDSGVPPKDPDRLLATDGRPILFSEGHYYESGFHPAVNGHSAWVPVSQFPGEGSYAREMATHALNWIGTRKWTVQSARVAGFPANIIHVDRGIGRWIQPLAVASVDRIFRGRAGGTMRTRFRVLHDLAGRRTVTARFRLMDGGRILAEKTATATLHGSSHLDVDLDLPLPDAGEDRDYNLQIEAFAEGYAGHFRDDLVITAFAPATPPPASGGRLLVYDPEKRTTPHLKRLKIPFTGLEDVTRWTGGPEDVLMVGSEALHTLPPEQLPLIRSRVQAGGRLIALDHRTLPPLLRRRLVQRPGSGALALVNSPTPLTRGLLSTDLQFWQTRDADWITQWGSLELPTSGLARNHIETPANDNRSGASSLLEVAEGRGRVIFCQLNLQAALGLEPAADRLLANLAAWGGTPSPFAEPASSGSTLLLSTDAKRVAFLRERLGVEGRTASTLPKDWGPYGLVLLDAATLNPPPPTIGPLRAWIEAGGTLFVFNPAAASAGWLGGLVGGPVGLEDFAHSRGHLLGHFPLTMGLNHGSFFLGPDPGIGQATHMETGTAEKPGPDSLAHVRITGGALQPLMRPAFLAAATVGKGRIIACTLRTFDQPSAKSMHLLSTLLGNAGARLTAGGILEGAQESWDGHTLDLAPFVNHPLTGAGPTALPTGRQTFLGIGYLLATPSPTDGHRSIALGTLPGGKPVERIQGIPVGRKADRLAFLHHTSGKVEGLTYRVYYTEARKNWIPGQPDPFIDIPVRNGSEIGPSQAPQSVRGAAEIAWSTPAGSPEQAVIYQFIWENPLPDREIESIDLIANPTSDGGTALVHAITAATRAPLNTTPSAEGRKLPEEGVVDRWRGSRFGLFVRDDGSIPALINHRGEPLLSLPGGGDGQKAADITAGSLADGTRVYQVRGTPTEQYTWEQTIRCTDGGIRLEWTWTPLRDLPTPPDLSLNFNVLSKPTQRFDRWGRNPLEVLTEGGTLAVGWDPRVSHWFKAYWVRDDTLTFIPFFEQEWKTGKPIRFWVEIGL